MSTVTDTISWGEHVAQRLLNSTVCPVCAADDFRDGCCAHCGADLRGAFGIQVWNASISAAAALRTREALLSRVPRVADAPVPTPAPAAAPAAPAPTNASAPAHFPASPPPTPPTPHAQHPATPPTGPRSSATVQSVLAIAGAGLFAIAALIFTFLNPDLSDRGIRSVVVGLVTLVFLGGAWMLARRGLQFSSEVVGALALVFVALDVYSFAQLGSTSATTWLLAALATSVASGLMLAAGRLSKIRVWPWAALIGIAVVPAMFGYATGASYVSALGHLAAAFLAAVLIAVWPLVAKRSLAAIQVIAVLSAVPLAVLGSFGFTEMVTVMLSVSLVLALIAVHAIVAARLVLRHWWSLVAGGAATAALVLAVTSPVAHAAGQWLPAALPTAAAFAFALISVSPLPRAIARSTLAIGGIIVVALIGLMPLVYAAASALDALTDVVRGTGPLLSAEPSDWAPVLGMLGIAAGIALFGGLARDRDDGLALAGDRNAALALARDGDGDAQHREGGAQLLRPFAAATDVIAIGAAALAVLTLACSNLLPLPARLIIVLGAAAATAMVMRTVPSIRNTALVNRVVLIIGIHAAIAVGVLISWLDPQTAPLSGLGVLAALALAAMALPAGIRFLHVGVGFAYALVCLGQALAQTELGSIAVLCLVASAGLIGAIVVTFLPQVGSRNWYAVLGVTAIPFAAGIVQVIFERSGWTALSTALMFALALSLLLTRRPGLNIILRTLAAGMLVPTVAVVVVCLGAQVLAVSASPVTLPVIAAIVALALPSTTLIRDALRRNGLPADASAAVRVAIEASALLTGVIATALALAREAAGLGTTFLVLVILGIGAGASAVFTRRRYGWWVAGAAFTGALWCVWTMNGVDLLEAYLLPPALAAAVIAAILAARGVEVRGLYATGLGVAVLPSLALLALIEPDARTAVDVPWRAIALLGAGALLLVIGAGFARLGQRLRTARVRMLVPATLAAAGLAAIAGPVQGIRMGIGADLSFLHESSLFLACFGVSALAAIILAFAGRGIRSAARATSRLRTTRWIFAPAVLALAAGTWCAIERDWGSIWMMWALMIGILALMLTAAVRAERTTLPPVWFLFAVAFVTAVVAWSPRDLRVEWFSLPLGAFLLLAGIAGMRGSAGMRDAGESAGTLSNWPAGRGGSWALLAPGLITMMSASIVATFTDPLTWRAILVMVLALAAIMVGAGRRLAAPFIIGMLVLPIENVFVFSVQIGRGIESMPWWITLAVIGAVLLIIAVTYERRTGDAETVAARIRDLR